MHGNGLDEILSMRRGGQDYFYHADDLGSIAKITDSTGNAVRNYEYDDYGTPIDPSTTSLNPLTTQDGINSILFAGARFDFETGFVYLRSRYLDVQYGRFTTRDSIGIWGDAGNFGNGSAYVGANPWTYTDPQGTAPHAMPKYQKYLKTRADKRDERCRNGMMGNREHSGSVSNTPGTAKTLGDLQHWGTASQTLSPDEVNDIIKYATTHSGDLSHVRTQVCGGPDGCEAFFNLTPNTSATVTRGPDGEWDWGKFALDVGIGVAAGVGMFCGVTEALGALGLGGEVIVLFGESASIAVPAVSVSEGVAAGAGVGTTVFSEEMLSRLGTSNESAGRLGRKASEAEEGKVGIHGVSVTAGEPSAPASQALRSEVEQVFKVHNTPSGNDPLHRTVELPKPVTQQIAKIFNQLFGRR